jgi:multidrug/hemolysin transport system ATP-binding protein
MSKIITIENISKNYKNIKALDDISFSIEEGSFVSILGPNGSGKSTLNNLLAGLTQPTLGNITYNSGLSKEDFTKYIGMVFQHNVSDDLLTVKENLYFYGALAIKDKVKLEQRYEELKAFTVFESFENKRFNTLSGGQKRLVEIARALFVMP